MWIETFEGCDPIEAAARLRPLGRLAFLDSAAPGGVNGRFSALYAAPFAEWTASLADRDRDPFRALDEALSRYRLASLRQENEAPGPGLVGFLTFEAGHLTERLARTPDFDPDRPLLSFGFYDTALVFDHALGTAHIKSAGFSAKLDASAPLPEREDCARHRLFVFRDALMQPSPACVSRASKPLAWQSSHDEAGYAAMVERVREYIRAGDIYQANVARRLRADLPRDFDSFSFYRTLRRVNAAPFAAYLEASDRTLASASPELFLRLRDREVETRPIKGTIRRPADPRGDPDADRSAAAALLASEKDRAENVMIVDLLRNDLSRIAEPDSVDVPTLCEIESYRGLHHLVSVVRARLQSDETLGSLLRATFPGGSITGAPKIRAIDIITELEGERRDVYCGSVGYFGFDGSADLSIAIRTVEFEGSQARFGVGGGVTILSDGRSEFQETETKAARVLRAFEEYASGSLLA